MSDQYVDVTTLEAEMPPIPASDTAKKRQILDGARKVFLSDGFDGASMNEIARVAGVSKGTLYVYFDSKEALFEELVRTDKRRQAEQMFEICMDQPDVRAVLRTLGVTLLSHMANEESVAQVRTIIGISGKLPQIGRAFYEAGPAYGIDKLTRYLDSQVAAGVLGIHDTRFAAIMFVDICQSGGVKAKLFGMDVDLSPEAIAQRVERAIDFFLAAYGTDKSG